jgi:predicted dehydrogenase
MKKPVRWGVLGAAKIARDQVCPAIHQASGGVLAALASRSPDKTGDLCEQYPGLKIHDGYDAMLADPDIDAIYIPLPNDMHIPMSMRCLEAGKHVLCEKPIAMSAGEIDALVALRDQSGLQAGEAFMVVHHPQWMRVREILASNELGALAHVSGVFTYNNAADPANIRNSRAHGGGGLPDIGVYPVVTTRFVTGAEPLSAISRIDWQDGVDLSARVMADFAEFSMDFYCSMRMGLRQEMLFHCRDGWLRVAAPFNVGGYGDAQLEIRTHDGSSRIERFAEANQYQLMIEAFNRSVDTGEPFVCTLEFSRANQAAIDMITAAGAP